MAPPNPNSSKSKKKQKKQKLPMPPPSPPPPEENRNVTKNGGSSSEDEQQQQNLGMKKTLIETAPNLSSSDSNLPPPNLTQDKATPKRAKKSKTRKSKRSDVDVAATEKSVNPDAIDVDAAKKSVNTDAVAVDVAKKSMNPDAVVVDVTEKSAVATPLKRHSEASERLTRSKKKSKNEEKDKQKEEEEPAPPITTTIATPTTAAVTIATPTTAAVTIATPTAGQKGTGCIVRLWSEADEFVVLRGLVEFKNEKGLQPESDWGVFYEYIKGKLQYGFTKDQLRTKIRKFKEKLSRTFKRCTDGSDPVFASPHDEMCFEFSKKLWGSNDDKLDEKAGVNVGKQKRKKDAVDVVVNEGKRKKVAVNVDKGKGKGKIDAVEVDEGKRKKDDVNVDKGKIDAVDVVVNEGKRKKDTVNVEKGKGKVDAVKVDEGNGKEDGGDVDKVNENGNLSKFPLLSDFLNGKKVRERFPSAKFLRGRIVEDLREKLALLVDEDDDEKVKGYEKKLKPLFVMEADLNHKKIALMQEMVEKHLGHKAWFDAWNDSSY